MSIVVGFVPTNEGRAALRRAAEEAKFRSTRLVVINAHRGGKDLASDDAVRYEAELAAVQREAHRGGYRPRGAPVGAGSGAC